ncbi:MAG: hypothetical protein K8I00_00775 [Candidatus Omnitrophica bacterium]|nr:hypothetical protein [Candidatus Omnitrophota bacterium]
MMSENVFNLCVTMLLEMAEWTGMSYKQINVLIFCILWPIVTVVLCWSNLKLRHRLRTSAVE